MHYSIVWLRPCGNYTLLFEVWKCHGLRSLLSFSLSFIIIQSNETKPKHPYHGNQISSCLGGVLRQKKQPNFEQKFSIWQNYLFFGENLRFSKDFLRFQRLNITPWWAWGGDLNTPASGIKPWNSSQVANLKLHHYLKVK